MMPHEFFLGYNYVIGIFLRNKKRNKSQKKTGNYVIKQARIITKSNELVLL